MDVRISYGVDINKVPEKIIEMLHASSNVDIHNLVSIARELVELSEDNIGMAIEIVTQARMKLASIDRSLNDCEMIMRGFVSAKSPPQESPPQEGPLREEPASDVD